MPTRVAERLLLEGFFQDVADAAPVPAVAGILREALAERLDRRTGPEFSENGNGSVATDSHPGVGGPTAADSDTSEGDAT